MKPLIRLNGRPILGIDDNNTGRDTLQNLRGARLLVEDNDLNQQVAGEMLTNAGFVVEMAENWQLALGKIAAATEPYDLWRALRTSVKPRAFAPVDAQTPGDSNPGRSPGAFDAAQPRRPEGIDGLDPTLGLKRVLGKVPRYMALLETVQNFDFDLAVERLDTAISVRKGPR